MIKIDYVEEFKKDWIKLRENLKRMNRRQQIEHLWEYYKWVLGVLAGLVMLVMIITTGVRNANTEILLAGELININTYQEGHDYISTDYFEKLQGIKGKQKIILNSGFLGDGSNPETAEGDYYTVTRSVAEMAAENLDYMILDEVALNRYLAEDMFLDLNQLFAPEELAQMEEELIYLLYEETGVRVPIAIRMNNTGYAKRFVESDKKIFIVFAANTPRKDACRAFWDYLVACETQ